MRRTTQRFALFPLAALALAAIVYGVNEARTSRQQAAQPFDVTAQSFELVRFAVEPIEPFELDSALRQETLTYDRSLAIEGAGFYGTSFGPDVYLDGVQAETVVIESERLLRVAVPRDVRGSVRVKVVLPDGRALERLTAL
jgi:hypothetical protein